jgi:hypothetical protein
MITRDAVVVESVEPLEGQEGTIVTITGTGFARHPRNNCVVVGGMGACARAEGEASDNRLQVRVGPVGEESEGDLLIWPGVGLDLYTEKLTFGESALRFSEASVFRNGAPTASAGVTFRLTKASSNAYKGYFEQAAGARVELAGHESGGAAMRVSFPKGISFSRGSTVDICVVLKEPTVAIDFTAEISGAEEDVIRAIAKAISVNASLIGETVFADVVPNEQTGGLDLYVAKPYLQNGMVTVHFNS